MTHRVFSRNASSSRAIPVERLINDVLHDTAMPLKWLSNKAGMQGGEEIIGGARESLMAQWFEARDNAVRSARHMTAIGAHKQHINRVIEPFSHINVLVTSTSWANWDALRNHEAAQPEIQELAKQIKAAADASTPGLLRSGQWHLPYVEPADWRELHEGPAHRGRDLAKTLIKLSVARCARVSYMTQEGSPPKISEDLRLYERLMGGVPLHASPAEHQATPDEPRYDDHGGFDGWDYPEWHGNFNGWIQFRKTLAGEYIADASYVCPPTSVNDDLSESQPS